MIMQVAIAVSLQNIMQVIPKEIIELAIEGQPKYEIKGPRTVNSPHTTLRNPSAGYEGMHARN